MSVSVTEPCICGIEDLLTAAYGAVRVGNGLVEIDGLSRSEYTRSMNESPVHLSPIISSLGGEAGA